MLRVESVSALSDNHIWLFKTGDHTVAAVDPGEAKPVIRYLEDRSLILSHILLTHHHHDHVGGVETLRNVSGAVVMGAEKDRHRLPSLDVAVVEGQRVMLGEVEAHVLEVPGHTLGHVIHVVNDDALFSGDTLFRFGCGRLFEGTPKQMWESMKKIKALPDSIRLFAAHEYTRVNVAFACALEPENIALRAIQEKIVRQTEAGQTTMPCLLGEEKHDNPFLRADDPVFAQAIGLGGKSAEDVFTIIRQKRNDF